MLSLSHTLQIRFSNLIRFSFVCSSQEKSSEKQSLKHLGTIDRIAVQFSCLDIFMYPLFFFELLCNIAREWKEHRFVINFG